MTSADLNIHLSEKWPKWLRIGSLRAVDRRIARPSSFPSFRVRGGVILPPPPTMAKVAETATRARVKSNHAHCRELKWIGNDPGIRPKIPSICFSTTRTVSANVTAKLYTVTEISSHGATSSVSPSGIAKPNTKATGPVWCDRLKPSHDHGPPSFVTTPSAAVWRIQISSATALTNRPR